MTHNSNNTADQTAGQARPPKPIPLLVIAEHIPADLKTLDQWLVWRYFYKPNLGSWDKPPLDANKSGNAAKSTDPKTWATFDKALSTYQLGNLDGIGLALTEKNGIVGFDLDDCRDPETGIIDDVALKIVERCPPIGKSHRRDRTPRVWLWSQAWGSLPIRRLRNVFQGRYLCLTGHHLEGTPTTIEPLQAGIDAIYTQMFPTQARPAPSDGDSPYHG